MKRFLIFILLPVAAVFFSCQTTDVEIPENLTPGEFFQEAQTASSEYGNYNKALVYYNTFIERYPDETLLIIEAEYEIALLYYKLGDDETAVKLFNGLLEKYDGPEAAILPAWPKVLSQKMIDIIEKKDVEEEADTTPAE